MSKIRTLRSLIREMRYSLPGHEKIQHTPAFSYMMEHYRKNAVTDQQYCREQEEMAHIAQTCATYLESSRRLVSCSFCFSHFPVLIIYSSHEYHLNLIFQLLLHMKIH